MSLFKKSRCIDSIYIYIDQFEINLNVENIKLTQKNVNQVKNQVDTKL